MKPKLLILLALGPFLQHCAGFAADFQMILGVRAATNQSPNTAASKLSPELQIAKSSGSAFVGFGRQGEAVLAFKDGFTTESAISVLEALPEVTNLTERYVLEPFDRIDKLVVSVAGSRDLNIESLANMKVVHRYDKGQFVVVESPAGFSASALRDLANDSRVTYVEPAYHYKLDANLAVPNDAYWTNLWHLPAINAPSAWHAVRESPVVVAIIDTGVDVEHEDLKANMWPKLGFDFFNRSTQVSDYTGHGTRCAGIIGAVGNNQLGVVGINWKVGLMALQIFNSSGSFTPDEFSSSVPEIVEAIDYAITNGAKVINVSWGAPFGSTNILNALKRAELNGVLVVASAGNGYGSDNDGSPHYPSSYDLPNIISVLSIDPNETLSRFSNFGKHSVHIGAPGWQILSTTSTNNCHTAYETASGTSYAAPQVAGAAALIWSHPAFRKASYAKVRQVLFDHARALPSLKDKCVTGGLLDLSFLAAGANASSVASTNDLVFPNTAPASTNVGPSQVYLKGTLKFPVFAIGGETTGTVLDTPSGSYELLFTNRNHDAVEEIGTAFSGKRVAVKGILTVTNGLEVKTRRLILIDDLKLLSQ